MSKIKKVLWLMLIILILLPAVINVVRKVNKSKIHEYCKLPENVKNYINVLPDGSIVVKLDNGEIWQINKEGNKFISSELKYVSNGSGYVSHYIAIGNNGDIFNYAFGNYKGNRIGNIPSAASGEKLGSIKDESIMIVTEEGDLYSKGTNHLGIIGMGDNEIIEEFTKVEGIPKVKKVVSGRSYSLILTVEGDIYYSGYYLGNVQTQFIKCQSNQKYTDIVLGHEQVYALDEFGNVYVNGGYKNDDVIYMSFSANKEYENIVSMKVSGDFSVFLSNTGKVYYKGVYFHGKAVSSFEGKPFTFHGVEEIMLNSNQLYLVKDGMVYIKDLSK